MRFRAPCMLREIYPLQVMEPLLLPVANLQLLSLRGPTHKRGVEQSCGLQLQVSALRVSSDCGASTAGPQPRRLACEV